MTPQSNVPDFGEREAMWSAIDFPLIEDAFPAVERYVRELRPLYANGKVEHRACGRWYREGVTVDVYYCPLRPQWACLEPGGFVTVAIVGMFAAICFGLA